MIQKLILLALLPSAASQAAVILTQGPPNDNATNIVDFRVADDFTLSQTTVLTSVSFWYQAQFQDDLSSLAYAFYTNAGGAPGSTLFTGTATPQLSTDANAFLAAFSVPLLQFAPGTYWLELHGGTSLTDDTGFTIFWAATADNSTAIARLAEAPFPPGSPIPQSGFQQYAFQLEGRTISTPAPEPAMTLPLVFIVALIVGRSKPVHKFSKYF